MLSHQKFLKYCLKKKKSDSQCRTLEDLDGTLNKNSIYTSSELHTKTNISSQLYKSLLWSWKHKTVSKPSTKVWKVFSEAKAEKSLNHGLCLQEIFPKETHKTITVALENILKII